MAKLVDFDPSVQKDLDQARERIEKGESVVGLAIPGLPCISCHETMLGGLEKTGAHLDTCTWNWFLRCTRTRCRYMNSLAKYFGGGQCDCAQKQRKR